MADQLADLTEVYTAAGVPGEERVPRAGLHGLLGGALFNYQRTVGETDRRTVPLPILVVTYGDWAHWSLGGGGVWLHSSDRALRLGVGVKLHAGWKPDDDVLLAGMEERDHSLDGSVNFLWRTRVVNLGLNYYHDLLDVSDGAFATLRVSRSFLPASKFRLTPSVGAEWQSAALVDYYYGVRPAEALPGRPAYAGSDATNISAGLTGAWLITPNWSLLGGVQAMRFGNGVADSPIVRDRLTSLVFFGAGWRL